MIILGSQHLITFFSISGFVNAFTFAVLGLLVLSSNPKRKLNVLYALFTVAAVFWAVSYGIWLLADNQAGALFWARMLNFGAIFVPVTYAHWILSFLGAEKTRASRAVLIFGYLFTLFVAVFGFSSYYVNHVEPKLFFPFWPMPGALHPFYLSICWIGLLGYALFRLFRAYKLTTSNHLKAQIKYIIASFLFAFGGGATNFLLWYGINFAPWGNPFVAIWPIILTYSILHYRFMDIRWVLGRTGIYALSFFIIILYTFGLFIANQQLGSIMPPLALSVIAVVTSVLLFLYFFRLFEKMAARYFYYTIASLRDTLGHLSKRLNQTIELDKLGELVSRSLLDALKIDKIGIILGKPGEKEFILQSAIKFEEKNIASIFSSGTDSLPRYFRSAKKALLREEITFVKKELENRKNLSKQDIIEKTKNLIFLEDKMENNAMGAILPLFIEDKLIGAIILGDKLSASTYSVQEMDLLESLSSQAAIAFNNALAYQELQGRKEELEKFYKLTVGRELRMVELKNKIKELEDVPEDNTGEADIN